MKAVFRLTPRAIADLRNIGRFTLQKWGREQRNTYLRALDQRFFWLAENPQRGRLRAEIAENYYSFAHGSHMIFYIIQPNRIDIIGIPHQAMDIITHLVSKD
jgi:toxin ParE1/3/4